MRVRLIPGLLVVSVWVFLRILTPSAVAGGAEHTVGGNEANDWGGLAFAVVNFSLFLIVMHRFAWPALRDFLRGRRREITDAMTLAAQAMVEADEIRRASASKEAALDETRRRMVDDIREGAAADRQRALAAASEIAKRLKADAERQSVSELARARRELRIEAAGLAAKLAEVQLRDNLNAEDRSRLIKEFVVGVSQA